MSSLYEAVLLHISSSSSYSAAVSSNYSTTADVVYDDIDWPNNTGNGTDRDLVKLMDSLAAVSKPNYWCLLLLIFPVVTVFGNVLVCLSVYSEKSLHTVTNYFIVSLAIADIMVAILVMPLAVYVEVGGSCHSRTHQSLRLFL